MYLDQVKTQLAEAGFVPPSAIRPCTWDEILALEQRLNLQLPAAYKEFLLWMGHGAGSLFRGSDVFYDDLDGLKEAAIELLRENGLTGYLPEDAFVFYMHQGYQFDFLRTSEGDDPPLYHFGEGEGLTSWLQTYNHFSSFVVAAIAAHRGLRRHLNNPI